MPTSRWLLLILLIILLILPLQPDFIQAQTPVPNGVITTNYPNPGDTVAAPIRTTAAAYNDYSNMETDPVSITSEQRDSVLAKLKKELAPGINVVTVNRWDDAQEGLDAIQIVNNVAISGALFTIFLPPKWQRQAHIPIVLSGDGLGNSNNSRFWKVGDTGLIGLVGLAGVPGFNHRCDLQHGWHRKHGHGRSHVPCNRRIF